MPNLINPDDTKKRCTECDRPMLWSEWFCNHCGGRARVDRAEGFRAAKGENRKVIMINDGTTDIVLHILPYETVRLQPGQIVQVPNGYDQNTLIRFQPDGSIKIGARVYAESGQDVKEYLEQKG